MIKFENTFVNYWVYIAISISVLAKMCLTTIISRVQRQLYFPLFSIIKEPLY